MRYFSLLLPFVLLLSCSAQDVPLEVQTLRGETMGTYYQVSYVGAVEEALQPQVDSLLAAVNKEVSTYDPSSLISSFNLADHGILLGDAPHMRANLALAREVYEKTEGAFDPTVMPLVNFWGFGYTEDRQGSQVDTAAVEKIRSYVGFDLVTLKGDSLLKTFPEVQLDFSACAKGYGIDQLSELLDKRGYQSYLVDIGGEARAKGRKPEGQLWRVGINIPEEDAALNEIFTAVPLENITIATSGNYRNWYEADGVKYSHTINPRTGFPERTELLSASVFHKNCMAADAYATACMVLGVEKALSLAQRLPEIEIYLIFSRPDGSMEARHTSGLNDLFNE
jgi:thiamine biosynthesis lipoprotein